MSESNADGLLSAYLLWGIVSICTFIIFVALLWVAVALETTGIILYFVLLLAGFLWIGVTSISRHVFVMLKRHLGKDISVFEFLSTQFIVLLFPFFYMKLKKEVSLFKGEEVKNRTGKGA
ncbi:MAG: hypothetical protein EHM54_03000 [Nitrospiraceae bacterium]|jgi:hypothetical protein|nr:MAG: hypothetical protein EHM54_03000 [Nitrospiraceae bacterium]